MADIRINALATTATTPASDDYLALDGTAQGTRKILATNIANNVTDVILGSSGPSVKSSLSARAPRQGLVFDGTAGATATISALGTAPFTVSAVFSAKSLAANNAIIDDPAIAGILIYVSTAGRVVVLDRVTSTTIYQTAADVIEVNKLYHITYSRVVGLFINGVNVSGTVTDASNYTSTLYRIGWAASSDSFCTGFLSVLIYNRALSASEVVALYESGAPAGADYNSASNTSKVAATFASGWTAAGGATLAATATIPNGATVYQANLQTPGKKVRFTVTVDSISAGVIQYYNGSAYVTFASTPGTYTVEYTSGSVVNQLIFAAVGGTVVLSSPSVYWIGLLLAPDAAQAGGGLVWYDTSGNAANISWTSGVSWNVPTSGYVTSGSSLNLSAGGTNQNITLTPSGTGDVRLIGGTNSTLRFFNGATQKGALFFSTTDGALEYNDTLATSVKIFTGAAANSFIVSANGNTMLGTSGVDGGQKLQVNGNSGFLGHLEIPADKHIYMKQGNPLRWSSDGLSTGTVRADIYADSGGILYFRTNGTTAALNIDNFQTARFAGAIAINNTVQTAVGVASTHKVTISIGGTTYYLLATNV